MDSSELAGDMETVYLETTIISYLVARRSRDLLVAAHQQTTEEWWVNERPRYDCCISQPVIDEISSGDPEEAKKRIAAIDGLTILADVATVQRLTHSILKSGAIPASAAPDAVHVAIAAVHQIDYLLTWNCKHLANAHIRRMMDRVCLQHGHAMPIICTPEELMEEMSP